MPLSEHLPSSCNVTSLLMHDYFLPLGDHVVAVFMSLSVQGICLLCLQTWQSFLFWCRWDSRAKIGNSQLKKKRKEKGLREDLVVWVFNLSIMIFFFFTLVAHWFHSEIFRPQAMFRLVNNYWNSTTDSSLFSTNAVLIIAFFSFKTAWICIRDKA